MLTALRNKLKGLLDERATRQAELDAIVEATEAENRTEFTDEETATFTEARSRLTAIDEERGPLEARIAELQEIEDRAHEAEEARAELDAADGSPRTERSTRTNVRVGEEERVYRPDVRSSFFGDALAQREGRASAGAVDRLRRHAEQEEYESRDAEQRDVGTSAFGGLVVPQYLVDEFAPMLRDGRAFLNAIRRLPLPPEGMVFTIPRAQTGTAVAPQATQNSAVQETNADFDNDLTVNVRTFAGLQDVSRQSLERGTPGIDRLVYADLVADYSEKVDTSAIADDGTNGTHVGLLNITGENTVTYTDASPTVPEFWPKQADATTQIANTRRKPPTFWLMHGRRWGWLTAALDSANRPLVGIVADAAQAVNVMGVARAGMFGEGQIVGLLAGLPVVIDNNVPINLGGGTNEDRVFAIRGEDPIIWEENDGMPRELRFDEVGSGTLTVRLLVYGYSAFTAERRPEGVTTMAGTGLATPTF